jgi:uncharacterized coiled-coil DUF342 family protein
MNTHEDQQRAQWHADLARIAAQIEDLRTKVDTESQMLRDTLNEEIATLQSDLRKLEAAVDAVGPDAYARQIAAQIEDLRAKGDAAYAQLHLDLTEAEIRRLELAATTASEDARTKIMARIDRLKATRMET